MFIFVYEIYKSSLYETNQMYKFHWNVEVFSLHFLKYTPHGVMFQINLYF
jgi:hypothetical protein